MSIVCFFEWSGGHRFQVPCVLVWEFPSMCFEEDCGHDCLANVRVCSVDLIGAEVPP